MPVGDHLRQLFTSGALVEDHVVTADDGVTQTVERHDGSGNVLGTYTLAVDVIARNAGTLRQRALAALAVNNTFLANTSPTNLDVLNQLHALTRECSGLIMLLLGKLDDPTGA